jgi:hypothetical protein
MAVVCDESGHMEFPFSYPPHMALITLAQARLRIRSDLLTLGTMLNCFNTNRTGPELVPYIKVAKMGPVVGQSIEARTLGHLGGAVSVLPQTMSVQSS